MRTITIVPADLDALARQWEEESEQAPRFGSKRARGLDPRRAARLESPKTAARNRLANR